MKTGQITEIFLAYGTLVSFAVFLFSIELVLADVTKPQSADFQVCALIRKTTTVGQLRNLRGGCQNLQGLLWKYALEGDVGNLIQVANGEVDVDAPDPARFRHTALHFAAAGGHHHCISALLSAGAQIDCRNQYGIMPQHLAAEGGHAKALKTLCSAGADVNADSLPASTWTPLYYAVAYGHLEAAKVLIAHGARVHMKDEQGLSPLDVAERFRQRPDEIRMAPRLDIDPPPNKEREELVRLLSRVSGCAVRSVMQQSGFETFQEHNPIDTQVEEVEEKEDVSDGAIGRAGDTPDAPRMPKADPARGPLPKEPWKLVTEQEIEGSLEDLGLGTPYPRVKAAGRGVSDSSNLEVLTLEDETVAFEISRAGYRLVSRSKSKELVGSYYETLHSGLLRVSPGYKTVFFKELNDQAEVSAGRGGEVAGGDCD